ncbi:hypothetical protein QJQ58_01285 [Paenibacillus dendritiformis]|uniref:hypothetical protein n=1 Tax=Paenibacillus dendritiformis TaxID=130049 RepID=UPI00248C3EE4|nr:hypothetical protein [Paenibacillus dendritiformis]WGU94945.1 hypothetical protein QJQ58_01285 [Paenibacillus dendritiformis]
MTDNRIFSSEGLALRETALFGVSAMVATDMQAKGRGRELEQSEYPEKNTIFTVKNNFSEYLKDYLQNIFYH